MFAELLGNAILTPEQKALAALGRCFKCAAQTLRDVHADAGYRWRQCSRCQTVFCLPDGVAPCLTCAANHYCPEHNPAPGVKGLGDADQ